jgi:hypothetical protein
VSHSILDGVEVQITRLQSALGEDWESRWYWKNLIPPVLVMRICY